MNDERPILFSAEMVRAILDGRKTQTRRLTKPVRGFEHNSVLKYGMPHAADPWNVWWHAPETDRVGCLQQCPYGKPSDHLWVREAWALAKQYDDLKGAQLLGLPEMGCLRYAADCPYPTGFGRKRHARFMPRWASRITLEVAAVRAERVQDITAEDVLAEGLTLGDRQTLGSDQDRALKLLYAQLWDKINGERAPWESNPPVWVVTFRRLP